MRHITELDVHSSKKRKSSSPNAVNEGKRKTVDRLEVDSAPDTVHNCVLSMDIKTEHIDTDNNCGARENVYGNP